ncbi:MAG: hypothetical protein HDR80_09535 [Bacteroides sp.]|nr:hypothetical protein [Bacteroides sp.]
MTPEYIKRLDSILGDSLEQSAKEITVWYKKLKEAYELKKINRNPNIENDITVMEIYVLVLYTIIAIATFFRGDFKSKYTAEKRLNLKYLSFVSIEFYKSLFIIKKPNTLWHKLESFLSIGNHTSLIEIIDEVNQASSRFRANYFNSKRRDISIHYDIDLDVVYTHLCEISEEDEAKQISSILAILQPLSLVCSSYLYLTYPKATMAPAIPKENIILKKFRKGLYEHIYDLTGSSIQTFAKHLDQNMQSFHMIDRPKVRELLTEETHSHLSQFRECFKLGILLHYFYLDLGTAVRGYLQAENYYEQQFNVIRINVIIYEGYKKIFLPQNENGQNKSLWDTYIKIPVLATKSPEYSEEADKIEQILQGYSQNNNIEDIRHNFSHFKRGNKLPIIDLWDSVTTINPIEELNKALDFLNMLSRIIKLSKPCLEYFAEKEHARIQQNLTAPLDSIFAKAIGSCKTIEDKERLQRFKDELKDMMLGTFDKMIQRDKRNTNE